MRDKKIKAKDKKKKKSLKYSDSRNLKDRSEKWDFLLCNNN